jgi:hypothetical protein
MHTDEAMLLQEEIQRLMQEWDFKDQATVEAFLRARQHQLKHRAASKQKRLLQVRLPLPSHRNIMDIHTCDK